jgi:hypothetical protein
MEVSEFIDALGGNGAVGAAVGVGASAVSNWRRRGTIPPRLYFRIVELAEAKGVEVDPVWFRPALGDEASGS